MRRRRDRGWGEWREEEDREKRGDEQEERERMRGERREEEEEKGRMRGRGEKGGRRRYSYDVMILLQTLL